MNIVKIYWLKLGTLIFISVLVFGCISPAGSNIEVSPTLQERDGGLPEPTDPSSLSELIDALSSNNGLARQGAARRLGAMGMAAKSAVPALTRNLYYSWGYEVRQTAAEALGNIGPTAKPAVPVLIVSLLTDFGHVRSEAAMALGKIGDPSAIPALVQALDDDEVNVKIDAAESIAFLADQKFPELGQSGHSLDENGNPFIVLAVKAWWEKEGQYRDWVEIDNR
jgi:HEAT repeat protein